MSYFLRAIIASKSDMERYECQTPVNIVDLPQSYCMIPLTTKLLLLIDAQSDSRSYIPGFLYLRVSELEWLDIFLVSGTFEIL